MSKSFSIYLDLVRFTAACLVYLYHSNQRWLIADPLPASDYGHSSVIVFFVLSGFIIAYITDTREKQLATYAASRISRIYSVALPAVLLTVFLDGIGRKIYPMPYNYPFDAIALRATTSLLMLNEWWFLSITSFSNVPYWSIGYEMWYYVFFGVAIFLPKPMRAILLLLLAMVIGPKVVLLAPIWLLGVVLYRWKSLQAIPEYAAWLLLVGTVAGIAAFHQAGVSEKLANLLQVQLGKTWYEELTFSNHFLADYILGGLVFLNFAAMRTVSHRIAPILNRLERPIRFLAAHTLSLYLLHQPLFLFWGAIIRGDPSGSVFWWTTTGMVVFSVFAVSFVTERRRHVLTKRLAQHLTQIETRIRHRHAIAK